MSRLISVCWGLVALAVMAVFDCGVDASNVKLIRKTTEIDKDVMESCGSGYVAIACHCYGSCKGLSQPNPKECKATKAASKKTTIALTCLMTDEYLYYTSPTGSCNDEGDRIISCYIRYTGQRYFLSDREISEDESGNEQCNIIEVCDGCSATTEVLCKKSESGSPETAEEP